MAFVLVYFTPVRLYLGYLRVEIIIESGVFFKRLGDVHIK